MNFGDVVTLAHDLPEHGLTKGARGAVVELYANGDVEVEFVAPDGKTLALITLSPEELDKVEMTQTYKLTYDARVEDPPVTREQIEKVGRGGCDAVVILSMLYPDDGSFSLAVVSLDGRTGEQIEDKELFKAWWLLASRLGESETLDPVRRMLAKTSFELIREFFLDVAKDTLA